jgi:hypothetical protein
MSKKPSNEPDFESLIDEFDSLDTLDTTKFPDVPMNPPVPRGPKGLVFPIEPSLSERDRNLILSQRNRLFERYVTLLRETLNHTTKICPQAKVSKKIRDNLTNINNLVTDMKTIDRNLNLTGGKKNNKSRRKKKLNKKRIRTLKNK